MGDRELPREPTSYFPNMFPKLEDGRGWGYSCRGHDCSTGIEPVTSQPTLREQNSQPHWASPTTHQALYLVASYPHPLTPSKGGTSMTPNLRLKKQPHADCMCDLQHNRTKSSSNPPLSEPKALSFQGFQDPRKEEGHTRACQHGKEVAFKAGHRLSISW